MALDEFGIIKKYFQPAHHSRADVIMGSGDDCAVLAPPLGQELVMTMDTMLVGRHFLASMDPADLAYKSVAVSLSDIAAMGAEPAWLLMSLSVEVADQAWLERFAQGVSEVSKSFGVALVGGDFTRGPLSVTSQISGFVPKGQAILRSGAKVGDKIFVTGTLGDAGLALSDQLGERHLNQLTKDQVYPRLLRPTPRVAEGLALRSLASSAIDLSDGLVSDLGHILKKSGVGAQVSIEALPFSKALQTLPFEQASPLALSAGDDYELCFTASPDQEPSIKALMPVGTRLSAIGSIVAGSGTEFIQADGSLYHCVSRGYSHF